MAEYLMLFRFTEKGVANVKDSPKRVKDAKKLFAENGAKVKTFYAVLGHYDTVFIVDAPDDETIARLSLQLSSLGNVHTETLRAFSEEQYQKMIDGIK